MHLLFLFCFALAASPLAAQLVSADSHTEDFQVGTTENLSGRIAFSANIEGADRIFVLDLDAKKVRELINGPGNNSYPSWSSDGKLLAFTSDRDGNKEIYLSNWEGDKQVRLTETKQDEDNVTWVPNSRRLVFYSEANKDSTNLHMLDLESLAKPVRLTNFEGRNTTPKVAPDGQRIAYTTNRNWPGWDVCIWSLENASNQCVLDGVQTYCRPDWSPNGHELAYSFGVGKDINLAVINLDSKASIQLSKLALREYDPTWSPNGLHIAFSAEDGSADQFKLYVIEKASKRSWPLLVSKHSIRYLSWTGVTTLQLEAQRMIETQKREEQNRLKNLPINNASRGPEQAP